MRLVGSCELSAGAIAAAFDVTRSAGSQHLRSRRLHRTGPDRLVGLGRVLDDMWASSLDVGGLERLSTEEMAGVRDMG